jgi:hypothetical protein
MLAERLLPLPKLLGPEVGLCSSPPVVDVGPITSVPAFALTRAWSALKNPANVSPLQSMEPLPAVTTLAPACLKTPSLTVSLVKSNVNMPVTDPPPTRRPLKSNL